MTPVRSAAPDNAEFRATYSNGSGYKTVYLTDWREIGNNIAAEDTDGRHHLWTAGSDVHIVEVNA